MTEKGIVTQPAAAEPRRGGGSLWYAGYILLAVFNVVTITGSLALNYRLVQQYENSAALNRIWADHLTAYAELEMLVSEANGPGNDVFASRDPSVEGRRMDAAMAAVTGKIAEIRRKNDLAEDLVDSVRWAEQTDRIDGLIAGMNSQTRELLELFAAGNIGDASQRMAAMDRTYAEIIQVVNRLEQEAQNYQRDSLGQQLVLAEQMRNIQYLIGSLIALLVVGVAAYGYRLARQMRRNDEERALQLAALEASEQRFRELTEGSIQGIIVHRDGVPLFVNEAWAQILGFEDAAEAGAVENIVALVAAEDRDSVRDIQYGLQHGGGNSQQYEYRASRRDGRTIWLECQERVVTWQGAPALQSTVIDATERKLAEESLHDAISQAQQATIARTRFFASASHDLRQPLHAISLYLPLLLKRLEKSENREMLGAIQNSCNAMRSLLDSLLDISRLDAGVIEPEIGEVALLDIFDQLGMEFEPQAAAGGLELRVVPADYRVRSDAALLERILRNLLTNAIRYTDKGRILIGARRAGPDVRVEVWDTGIGIDSETLVHIFEEFYQADNPERDRSRGLGLGLAIIERLATLLGHKLDVKSWPGRGSMFSVSVPLAGEPAGALTWDPQAPHAADCLQDRVAVLIDDDPIVQEGTEAMLEDWGCEVITASSASEALEAVSATGVVPDVILADLRLRGAETGLSAIAALHEKLALPIPAIVVTGDTDPERIRQATASGYIVLHKPVEPTLLQLTILKVIGEFQPGGAGTQRAST